MQRRRERGQCVGGSRVVQCENDKGSTVLVNVKVYSAVLRGVVR